MAIATGTALAAAAAASAAGGMWGAHNQNQTNNRNLNAQQQQQNVINQMVQRQMAGMNGQNPYAAALNGMIGQMRPPGYQGAPGAGMQPWGGMMNTGMAPGPGMAFSRQMNSDAGANPDFNGEGYSGTPGGTGVGGSTGYGPGNGSQPGLPGGGQFTAASAPLYQYQNSDPFTYDPTMLGAAPQVQAGMSQFNPMAAPNQINIASLMAPQLGATPQIGVPGQVSTGQVGANMITGTQGYNAGQDGLLQMMQRDIGAPRDQFLGNQLQQLGMGNSQFDNSSLFAAMAPMDQRLIDEQVGDLYGKKQSFGDKFGSATRKQETDLRSRFAENIAARNAGIQQQSFESAQNRRMGALGQIGNQEQFFGQMPFQNAQLQLQAAQAAGNLGQGSNQLNLQAQLANQQTQLQASQANAANQLEAGQFNVQTGMNAQQTNAQLAQQAALAQAQMGMQAGMQNQQMSWQQQQQNAANMMQQQQFNSQMGMQNSQFNIGNQLQAGLANQNWAGQFGMGNANIANQAGQFNANAGQQSQQFNTAQGNQYNQLLMQMMSQANSAQMGQQGLMNQLVGIQAGQQVPMQQPSAWPGAISDAASTAMMLPMLGQFMQPSTGYNPGYNPQPYNTQGGTFGIPSNLSPWG